MKKTKIKKDLKSKNGDVQPVVKQDDELQNDTINIGSSVVGAIVGATTSPAMVMTYNILNRAFERRKERTIQVVENAFNIAKITPDDAILLLNSNDNKVDDLISLLRIIAETDPSIDNVLSSIIGENLKIKSKYNRDRLLILADSIRNMRSMHLQILKTMHEAGGTLEATVIAEKVKVPVIELRSVVRDLELRGMILDTDKNPIEWKLRELGNMLITFANDKK
jgi:hypothetical protein